MIICSRYNEWCPKVTLTQLQTTCMCTWNYIQCQKMCRTLLPNENGYEFSERESFPHCGCAGMWRLLILILGICEGAKLIVWPAAWRPEPPTGQWTTRAFLDMSASRNTVIPETRCSVFWGLHQSQAKIYKMSVADCRLKCPGVTWATILISRFIKCNFLLPLQVIFYLVRKRQEKKKHSTGLVWSY